MQSFSGGGVDLDRFLDELRIPHELDLALSRPDENYQRLRSCNDREEQQQQQRQLQQQFTGPPPPKKSAHPSRHHQELLRRLNSSRDFGSHKQDLSIVKLPRPDSDRKSDGDKMLNEYMERIQELENKKRKVKVAAAERNVSRSASTDNVLASEFMVARQRFNLANVDEAESDRDAIEDGEGGRRRYGTAGHSANHNGGGGGQFLLGSINLTSQVGPKYKHNN